MTAVWLRIIIVFTVILRRTLLMGRALRAVMIRFSNSNRDDCFSYISGNYYTYMYYDNQMVINRNSIAPAIAKALIGDILNTLL